MNGRRFTVRKRQENLCGVPAKRHGSGVVLYDGGEVEILQTRDEAVKFPEETKDVVHGPRHVAVP